MELNGVKRFDVIDLDDSPSMTTMQHGKHFVKRDGIQETHVKNEKEGHSNTRTKRKRALNSSNRMSKVKESARKEEKEREDSSECEEDFEQQREHCDEEEDEDDENDQVQHQPMKKKLRTVALSRTRSEKKGITAKAKAPQASAPRAAKGRTYFIELMNSFPRAFHEGWNVFYIKGDKYHYAQLDRQGNLYTKAGDHFMYHHCITNWLSSLSVSALPIPRRDIYVIDPSVPELVSLQAWQDKQASVSASSKGKNE